MGTPIKLSADLSKETLQARRGRQEIFKVMKNKDLQPRLFYPAKLSFRVKGQIDKQSLRQVKAKGVHHHQTSIARNIEGSSIRRRKKYMSNKMAINIYLQKLL